jgi:hypothetical protein
MFPSGDAVETTPPAQRITAALALVRAALDADLTALSDAALTEQLEACTQLLERVQALTAVHVGAWEPRKVWHGSCARTSRGWLARHTALGAPACGELLRAGRFVAAHDRVGRELRTGVLGFDTFDLLATP